MHRHLLPLLLSLAILPAWGAGKTIVHGAPGACDPSIPGNPQFRFTAAALRNMGSTPALASCSLWIDTSVNGSTSFGGVFHNPRAFHQTVTCKAQISTGGNGPRFVTKSVTVAPGKHGTLTWTGDDIAIGRVLFGGQSGFECSLPSGMTVENLFVNGVAN